jgi:hypothetical protein
MLPLPAPPLPPRIFPPEMALGTAVVARHRPKQTSAVLTWLMLVAMLAVATAVAIAIAMI